ncbi:MAG: ABC transporter ATP-binding protein [Armatimonadota bacterium]|nr:ABC transporter ATP-binding protein [Armatimonadota bacterium]MDR7451205.1 ABC transporter ATP-binding protein [Armatimonadota bacterium]MDR7467190.1 ABC transporter ATP-binding protein [Armatimonadota bacterium]MDR7495203.1 ABC transporter ATP-binding protein [Armatimonadota bacterium]MDR7500086.1 ABC transporter ATP-binding protein [Armatimonadota bacterium]
MIVVEHLTKRFGAVAAVDDVSFQVRRGEIFGLLGPDGAGKTTLFRMLAAVVEPTAGTAGIAGADIRLDPEGVKARVGYMPQTFALYGDLTVLENLRFVAEVFGVPRKEIGPRLERLLQFSRLEPFTGRRAEHLSGGMKQKLSLAATLLHEPEVLLLDEPTTGVDPVSRREFWQILLELNRRGKTVVAATPYMDEAERCHRVALMHRGRILSVDPPQTMRARFPGAVIEVVASPRREALAALRRMAGVRQATVFGEAVHVVVPADTAAGAIASALEAAGLRVQRLRRIEPSLEDVFVSLLGRSA